MQKVLVVIGYTDMKYYSRPLVPKIFNDLTYKEKSMLWVTDDIYPGLSDYESGELVAAMLRDYGIKFARKHEFDWIFFCDVDTIPDKEIIERLLEQNYPLIGGVHAARGDATKIIGHNYIRPDSLERVPLNYKTGCGVIDVDGTSGGLLLVHKSIFKKIDYSGYQGPKTILLRYTADDEFYQIKVRRQLKIKPKLHLGAGGWHLHSDGFAYRWCGEKKPFKLEGDVIKFNKGTYVKK